MAGIGNMLSIDQMLAGLGPALFSCIRAPFGIFDKDFRVVWINKSMAAIHRCDPEKVAGKLCYQSLLGCEHMCGGNCPLEGAIAKGRTHVVESWMDVPDGGRRWIEGYTNTQISELLDISGNTVKSYVNSLFNKLGVNDRTQAAVLATRNHIV